jgi:hypothetical protein
MNSYWGFLVGQTTAKAPTEPEGSWEWAPLLGLLSNGRSKLIGSENRRHGIT